MATKKILWIDDTPDHVIGTVEALRDKGFTIQLVSSASEGAYILTESAPDYFVVIVDLLMNLDTLSVPGENGPELLETIYGLNAGIVFGRWLKRRFPWLFLIGVSVKSNYQDPQVKWFREVGDGYFDKYSLFTSSRSLELQLRRLLTRSVPPAALKTFVIHGYDEKAKEEVCRFLTGHLRINDAVVLHELPAQGKEALAGLAATISDRDIHVVFTLLTPGDLSSSPSLNNSQKRRTRENVIFETGYLCGMFQGKHDKLFLLHKGETELPTDIPLLIYLDIRDGIESVGAVIKQELADLFPLLRR